MGASPSIWNHCLEYAAGSDVGLRRANNQDAHTVVLAGSQADFDARGHLFLVADGMGAHAAGELASKMAADVISLTYRKLLHQSPQDAIVSALLDANHQIHERGLASLDFRGMGTTATSLTLLPVGAIVAHVGDSRAYRLRGSRIEQLTFDHSLVWELRAADPAPAADLSGYVSKNIITRSLGPNEAVHVDLEGPFSVEPGDAFLLCSDGLSGQVSDDEIGMVLSCLSPQEAVSALTDLANLRGGPDNITVVIVRVLSDQVARETRSPSVAANPTTSLRPASAALWAATGAGLLGAGVLFTLGWPASALAALSISAAAAVMATILTCRRSSVETSNDYRHIGRGPYASCDCAPNADLTGRIADIVAQLGEAATTEQWAVDRQRFEQYLVEADAAKKLGNWTDAVRGQLRAMTFMMAQLRQLRSTSGNRP